MDVDAAGPIRAGAPARIALIGGEATGKTTLAHELGRTMGACIVEEQLRAFVDRHGRPPRADEQADVMRAQQQVEDAAAAACRHPLLIADPAPVMTAVYSLAYFDDPSLLDDGIALADGYALIGWCRPDLPWTPDGAQRDGPHRRAQVDALLDGIVARIRARGIPVLDLTGPTAQRADAVRLAWHRLGPQAPT